VGIQSKGILCKKTRCTNAFTTIGSFILIQRENEMVKECQGGTYILASPYKLTSFSNPTGFFSHELAQGHG
jgi:hypothetical protein